MKPSDMLVSGVRLQFRSRCKHSASFVCMKSNQLCFDKEIFVCSPLVLYHVGLCLRQWICKSAGFFSRQLAFTVILSSFCSPEMLKVLVANENLFACDVLVWRGMFSCHRSVCSYVIATQCAFRAFR